MSASRVSHELEELNRVGIALSETRDVDQLLELILRKSREITSADAGSLYLVEQADGIEQLRFKLTQNDSVEFPFAEFTLPLTDKSIAGYCARHGQVVELADAYRVPKSMPFQFNKSFDDQAGYRTRSLLALPMKNGKGEVLGVLQLLNCKRNWKAKLTDSKAVAKVVHAFPEHAVRLGLSLASQAAVAYENSRLYRDIENLFDGFVHASVKAIEQRDPTTSGHSHRVCEMTVALAEAVDREPRGPYAELRFSREQMKEIRYASLLHDFGKVGVREQVLVKAKKLYPQDLNIIRNRFEHLLQ
ncbi:MAG TPA: GAF domain-containing protein, partial [Candidatus Acidoferrum sp.]|nr:GAF domain-containing protein [Candidatus Acidoferrum sp.]